MFIHFASQQTEDTALHEEEEEEEGEGTRLHDPLPDVVAHSHRVSSCTGSHSYILSSPGGGVIIWLSQGVIIQLSGEGGLLFSSPRGLLVSSLGVYYSALPGSYYSALPRGLLFSSLGGPGLYIILYYFTSESGLIINSIAVPCKSYYLYTCTLLTPPSFSNHVYIHVC